MVAGLPDLSLDDGKLSYSVANFRTEIYPNLSSSDKELIDLYYLKYDNINLLKLLKDKEADIDLRGNYSAEELLALISAVAEGDDVLKEEYPSYFYDFLLIYLAHSVEEGYMADDNLATCYYSYAINCDNRFISNWFDFNLNINNILAAYTARRYKLDVASVIVGETEVSEAIRTSGARDFGLSGVLEYFEQLVRISEAEDLVEKERKIDLLRWEYMEDASFFNYFTVEKLFVFLLKLEIIERWILLDKEKGSELFRKIIESLKNDVKIPAEFR